MKNIWRIIPVLLLSVAMAGCSDDDDTTSSFFELSSTDLECNSNNVIDVVVPIEGQTYKLTVKSSVDVIWTTKLEGGSWIVATPVTKQSGDGEILIVASSNPTNIKNRVATVTIRNSVNDEIYRYAFTQSYDPNQMAQKEELYAYIHYNEDRYNKEELIYTTSINKVEGNVSISSLGQEELDKYNEDNLTLYKLLPTDCYTLPNSISFDGEVSALLDIKFNKKTGAYIYHKSELGEFFLGSDAITNSYKHHKSKQHLIKELEKDVEELFKAGSTIGAYIIFPNKKINGLQTINQVRGINKFIDDRFDLTLQCIKLFYEEKESPLYITLKAYESFFKLFETFQGYTNFFLLNDLVDDKYNIKFFLLFSNFNSKPILSNKEQYLTYKNNALNFIKLRNQRIINYINSLK